MKDCLDIVSKEYEQLGWHCRQYTKQYFRLELNYLEISAVPYRKPNWKEKVWSFFVNYLGFSE